MGFSLSKTFRPSIALTGLIVISACSSASKNIISEPSPDIVISRIDNLSERPSWLHESETFIISDGIVASLGTTTIPASDRVEAGIRIAENNAKAIVAQAIESKLEFTFQNAEEGTNLDQRQVRYIGSESASLTTSSLIRGPVYWEKVASVGEDGKNLAKYNIFVKVTMSESDFKRSILTAINRATERVGISNSFAQKVDQQWDNFAKAPLSQFKPEPQDSKLVPTSK